MRGVIVEFLELLCLWSERSVKSIRLMQAPLFMIRKSMILVLVVFYAGISRPCP
jgi:hypothetical protein